MIYDKNGCMFLQLYEKCHQCNNRCTWDGEEQPYSGCYRYTCDDASCNHGSWFTDKHHIGEKSDEL